MTYLKWVREGDRIPAGSQLVQVLMREQRIVGTGTTMAEFLLCELRDDEQEDEEEA